MTDSLGGRIDAEMEREEEVQNLFDLLRERIHDERAAECQRSIAEEANDAFDVRHYTEKRDRLGLQHVRERLRELGYEIPPDLEMVPPHVAPDLGELSLEIWKVMCAGLEGEYDEFLKNAEQRQTLPTVVDQAVFSLEYCNEFFPGFWKRFRGGLYHLTTVENWIKIRSSQIIAPSGTGNTGNHSYDPLNPTLAALTKSVAMFDLGAPDLGQIFEHSENWLRTLDRLAQEGAPTGVHRGIWLEISRESLPGRLEIGSPASGSLCLSYVEAHHQGAIPLSSVRAAYEVERPCDGPYRFTLLDRRFLEGS